MAKKTMKFISAKMKDLDICMMNTSGARGAINTRPMSNNKDVKYNGESFFFSDMKSRKVKDIDRNASVTLSFMGNKGLNIIVTGKARIIKSKAVMEEHWVPSLKNWFKKGLESAGLVMIAVKAEKIHYWVSYNEGEIKLR